jgi:hypothetical protein
MARGYKEWVVNLITVDHAPTAAQLPSCHIYTLHNYEMRGIRLNIAGCSVLVSIPGKVDLFLIHWTQPILSYIRHCFLPFCWD